jgi:hypothetical protein
VYGPDNPHPKHVNRPERWTVEGKYIPTEAQLANLVKFKKGEVANPHGRPSKRKLITREIQKRLDHAADLETASNAIKALKANSVPIIQEIMAIAMEESVKTTTWDKKKKENIVKFEHSQAKMKALALCVERIIPVLKVVEVDEKDGRKPHELTDTEIITMMQKMANLAGSQIELNADKEDHLDG